MKKIGLIGLALVFALGALGVGYAHWSQTLFVTGTVTTGSLQVALRDMGVNDDTTADEYDYLPRGDADQFVWWCVGVGDPGFDEEDDTQTCYTKDVASITSTYPVDAVVKCTHDIPEVGAAQDFYETEVITISNAYPSYAPGFLTAVANCGNIPVKLESFGYYDPDDPDTQIDFPCWIELLKWIKYEYVDDDPGYWSVVAEGASHPIPEFTNYGDQCEAKMIEELMDQQLHECDVFLLYVEFHTTQEFCDETTTPTDMPQDATFNFLVKMTYTQWNEVP